MSLQLTAVAIVVLVEVHVKMTHVMIDLSKFPEGVNVGGITSC